MRSLQRTAHELEVLALLLVLEWARFTLEPLQFWAPVSVPVRFVASVCSQLFSFFAAVPYLIPL